MDKDKAGEVAAHTVDELQKMALSFIPGGAVLDGFLGYWSRLKQKRVIDFSQKLKETLEQHAGRKLSSTDFENEDFIDIMESIYAEVMRTQSEYKLERFRNILARQIIQPNEVQNTLKTVSVLNDLTDIQIVMLDSIGGDYLFDAKIDFRRNIERYGRASTEESVYRNDNYTYVKIGGEEVPVLTGEIDFLVNDLVSKGLIIRSIHDEKAYTNRFINKEGVQTKSVTKYKLSFVGKKLLDKIMDLADINS